MGYSSSIAVKEQIPIQQEKVSTITRSNMDKKMPTNIVLTPQQQTISSGTGALVVSLMMTPLDVIKIRLQSQERIKNRSSYVYSQAHVDHSHRPNGNLPVRSFHTHQEMFDFKMMNKPKIYSGAADAFVNIVRTEGVTSLWSGLPPTLALTVPATVIYFTMYEQIKQKIELQRKRGVENEVASDGDIPKWVPLVSGCLARCSAVTLVNPLELVRTKIQSQKMPWPEVINCLKDLISRRGYRGLWNGYTATLMRDVPFSAMYWPLLEQGRSFFNQYTSHRDSFLVHFGSGAYAGAVASTLTLPFDVVKTIKQIEISEKDMLRGKSVTYRSNMTIVMELLKQQGPKALFAGLTPRLLKAAPSCAIMISSYEFCKGIFRQRNLEMSSLSER